MKSKPLSNTTKKVDTYLGPLFTERYTDIANCKEINVIASSNKSGITKCEDLNVTQLVQDEIIKTNNDTTKLLVTDDTVPLISSIPQIDIESSDMEIMHMKSNDIYVNTNVSIINDELNDVLLENERKRKIFIDNSNYDPNENLFNDDSTPKKLKVGDQFTNECKQFIFSVMNSFLASDNFNEGTDYEELGQKLNMNHIREEHKIFLQKVKEEYHMKGGKKIANICHQLRDEIVKSTCTTYFKLLGQALKKTFEVVAQAVDTSPSELDNNFSNIKMFESDLGMNGGAGTKQKTKFKAQMVLDLHAPNSIARKSATMTYFGHLRHHADVSIINDNSYPESKSLESRFVNLDKNGTINADSGPLEMPFALLHVENTSSDLPPKLRLVSASKESPEVMTKFLAPAIGKISTEITETIFNKKKTKADEKEAQNQNQSFADISGYVPCPLLKCDMSECVKPELRYDAVDAEILLPNVRKESVKFLDLTSDNFMSSQYKDLAIKYIMNYLTKLKSLHHTSAQQSILPPLITNVMEDIRRIACKISWLLELSVYVYDLFVGKKNATDLRCLNINTSMIMDVIMNVLQADKIIAGYFHLYCLITELYGDGIGVSQTSQYNVALERRPSWIKTLTRAFLRLRVDNGTKTPLKLKTLKTFLVDTENDTLITTLNDIIPHCGSYLIANMLYSAYVGMEAKTIYRCMTFGDKFFSGSIYSNILDLDKTTAGNQIIIGRHALYRNFSKRDAKKLDVSSLMEQLTMSAFIDAVSNKVISINELVDYYLKRNIIPKENIKEQKQEILSKCLKLHVSMIQENYEKRLFITNIFPLVWNVIMGKDPLASDEEDD